MNLYKNLMFLHGYLVDPREASYDDAAPAPAVDVRPAPGDTLEARLHARPLPPCPPRAAAARSAIGCLG